MTTESIQMFEQVSIRNFQSLRSVDLELGRLTVIVGASSSGKTALMRALRAISSNVRGSSIVTRGTKQASVSLSSESSMVTLERSETTSTYKIVDKVTGAEQVFTKLAGGVPEKVSEMLRISPVVDGSSINFAGQFDRPYLLDESGGQVARVLGELTNVNTIFEAVREANRRRLAASSGLKSREAEIVKITADIHSRPNLLGRIEQCGKAEVALARAQQVSAEINKLTASLIKLDTEVVHVDLPEVPDLTLVLEIHERLSNFKELLTRLVKAENEVLQSQALADKLSQDEFDTQFELRALLEELGICPTCGMAVK